MKVISLDTCRHDNEGTHYIKNIKTDDIVSCIEKERKDGIADCEIILFQLGNSRANETSIDLQIVNTDNLSIDEIKKIVDSVNRFYEDIKGLMNIRKRPGRM